MNVLSLFDGVSCGQVALDRLGISVDNYFAAEIDKYAVEVTKKNYPDSLHLGDVTAINTVVLPKIDLLLGGSPCQGFSFAGKQLAFDDPRSKLFFEYVRVLKELRQINPDIKFLLENVRMKKEYLDVITEQLGVEPIMINSSLVSAQNRVRYYWTNIKGVEQPEDKGILLKDILESGVVDRGKSFCTDASYYKGGNLKSYFEKHRQQLVFSEPPFDDGYRSSQPTSITKDKYPTLRANAGSRTRGVGLSDATKYWRKLTPVECERLQTLPANYTEGVSNTQRYKMLGNGWTVDVIVHILKNLEFTPFIDIDSI